MTRSEVLKRIPNIKPDRLASWLYHGHVTTMFDGAGLKRDFSETDVRRIARMVELTAKGVTLKAAVTACNQEFAPPSRRPLEYSPRDWLFV